MLWFHVYCWIELLFDIFASKKCCFLAIATINCGLEGKFSIWLDNTVKVSLGWSCASSMSILGMATLAGTESCPSKNVRENDRTRD